MFGRTIDPRERQDVLELLGRWPRAIARIDEATDAMRLTMAEQPMGMQSEEYEEARLAAIEVLRQVRAEISSPRFWPILTDNTGAKTMLELQKKLDECLAHQLNLLNLYGLAASAFRRGRQDQSPSHKDVMSANRSFARALDQMGPIGGKLARRYRISLQELQRELRRRDIGSRRTGAPATPPTMPPLVAAPKSLDLHEVARRIHGRPYKALIVEHLQRFKPEVIAASMEDIIKLLPVYALPIVKGVMDGICAAAVCDPTTLERDCGVVLLSIADATRQSLTAENLPVDDWVLFRTFKMVTLYVAFVASTQSDLCTQMGIEV